MNEFERASLSWNVLRDEISIAVLRLCIPAIRFFSRRYADLFVEMAKDARLRADAATTKLEETEAKRT